MALAVSSESTHGQASHSFSLVHPPNSLLRCRRRASRSLPSTRRHGDHLGQRHRSRAHPLLHRSPLPHPTVVRSSYVLPHIHNFPRLLRRALPHASWTLAPPTLPATTSRLRSTRTWGINFDKYGDILVRRTTTMSCPHLHLRRDIGRGLASCHSASSHKLLGLVLPTALPLARGWWQIYMSKWIRLLLVLWPMVWVVI
jgi:hypothetical protein